MQKEDSELETRLYLAFVYSGSLKDFEAVKDYAAKFTTAKLIFQYYSPR
jgi:hypothetical protein